MSKLFGVYSGILQARVAVAFGCNVYHVFEHAKSGTVGNSIDELAGKRL